MTEPKYKTDAFGAIHASAMALHDVGAIDTATMADFDRSCLVEVEGAVSSDLGAVSDEQKS